MNEMTRMFAAAMVGAALSVAAGDASALNLRIGRAAVDNRGNLVLYVSETGLTPRATLTYDVQARREVVYQCFLDDGTPLPAATAIDAPFIVRPLTTSARGTISGTIVVSRPIDPRCPDPFDDPRILRVTYSDIRVSRGGASATVPAVTREFGRPR